MTHTPLVAISPASRQSSGRPNRSRSRRGRLQISAAILSLALLVAPDRTAAQTVFAQGLQFPQRLIATPAGNLLVSEGGMANTPHTGRVSLVNRQGVRRSLMEGLPAARGHGIGAFGPAGMALSARTLYLLIGEGDVQIGPPFSLNPAGPSSPIFSSVLKIQFSTELDAIASTFQMTPNDHWALHDGQDLELHNADGDQATVHLLTIFRAVVRNVLGGPSLARPSDPYGAWLDAANNALYIADASAETLIRVNTVTGRSLVLTRFQPYERSTDTGQQFVDNVPTALCQVGDSLLVSFLTGSPFPQSEASVGMWNASNGSWSRPVTTVKDLNMVNDMLCLRGGTTAVPRVVTVELSTDSTIRVNPPTGRVQLHDGSQRRVLAQELPLPTGVTQDPVTGELFVATLTGIIYRLPAP